MAPIAMANLPRVGSAKCAAVVATNAEPATPEPRRQVRELGVALVIERMPVMSELDAHPLGPEPVDQVGERRFCR